MGEVYTCFQTETPQKPDPLGPHIPVSVLYKDGSPWNSQVTNCLTIITSINQHYTFFCVKAGLGWMYQKKKKIGNCIAVTVF